MIFLVLIVDSKIEELKTINHKKFVLSLALVLQTFIVVFSQTDLMNKSTFRIDSTEFEFETIGIIGIITEDENFCWAMDLYAKSGEFQGQTVSPKFSFTLLEEAKHYDHNESYKWKDVSAYNDRIDDWIASFYIYDAHFFTADVEIRKMDNENFFVSIEGKVNLNWETAPTKDFRDFLIKKIIPFNGIICEIDNRIL